MQHYVKLGSLEFNSLSIRIGLKNHGRLIYFFDRQLFLSTHDLENTALKTLETLIKSAYLGVFVSLERKEHKSPHSGTGYNASIGFFISVHTARISETCSWSNKFSSRSSETFCKCKITNRTYIYI